MLNRLTRFNLNYFRPSKAVSVETQRVGREHYIPVLPSELIDALVEDTRFAPGERAAFRTLCKHLTTAFHNESQGRLSQLRSIYSHLNPDTDTERLNDVTLTNRDEVTEQLFEQFVELIERANFRQLSRSEVHSAIGQASSLGVRLDLDLDSFDRLAVFARGAAMAYRSRRNWKKWFRHEQVEIPIYQRLVVIFQSKDDVTPIRTSYIRLFKNVPQQDIDMALPGGRVQMSLLDRGKILLPTISGIGLTAFKILKGAVVLAFVGVYGLLGLAGLIGGAIGSGWKSFNGYWKTKNKYELNLTRNLYYQNLDNNVGVLLRLAAEAESQELREAILGYFVLWMNRHQRCDDQLVNSEAERTLRMYGLEVDFETADALAKLQRLRLCHRDQTGGLRVESLDEAVRVVVSRNLSAALA